MGLEYLHGIRKLTQKENYMSKFKLEMVVYTYMNIKIFFINVVPI